LKNQFSMGVSRFQFAFAVAPGGCEGCAGPAKAKVK
jgi:hypothetical protein